MSKKITSLFIKTGITLGSVLGLIFAPLLIMILVISAAVYLELKGRS